MERSQAELSIDRALRRTLALNREATPGLIQSNDERAEHSHIRSLVDIGHISVSA